MPTVTRSASRDDQHNRIVTLVLFFECGNFATLWDTHKNGAGAMKRPAGTLDLPTLAFHHLSALTRSKAGYKKADAALDALVLQMKPGDLVTLPDSRPVPSHLRGKKFRLADKFEKRNSIPVGLNARRFGLEEVIEP